MRVDDLQAQFDAALATLLPSKFEKIGLAVSGGGDSIALLHLAARSQLIAPASLIAFTVDHRLRKEAADEARFVSNESARLGIDHQTLEWSAPDASQSRARAARHKLLAAALKTSSGSLLLTGHTLNDNLESFLIRARASSGWYGLSGMGMRSASPVWPEGVGVSIGRPMLQMKRDAVRRWLSDSGYRWCEDPSNDDEKYERVRMRKLLTGNPELQSRIEALQSKLSVLRIARDSLLSAWLIKADAGEGGLVLPFPATLRQESLAQLLSFAAMAVAGTERPARTQRSLSAAYKIRSSDGPVTLTLGGAVIRKQGESLSLKRESNREFSKKWPAPSLRLQHICTGLLN